MRLQGAALATAVTVSILRITCPCCSHLNMWQRWDLWLFERIQRINIKTIIFIEWNLSIYVSIHKGKQNFLIRRQLLVRYQSKHINRAQEAISFARSRIYGNQNIKYHGGKQESHPWTSCKLLWKHLEEVFLNRFFKWKLYFPKLVHFSFFSSKKIDYPFNLHLFHPGAWKGAYYHLNFCDIPAFWIYYLKKSSLEP